MNAFIMGCGAYVDVGRSARGQSKPSQKIDKNPDRVSTSALPFAAA